LRLVWKDCELHLPIASICPSHHPWFVSNTSRHQIEQGRLGPINSCHTAAAIQKPTGRTHNQTVVAIAVTRCAVAAEEKTNNQTVAASASEKITRYINQTVSLSDIAMLTQQRKKAPKNINQMVATAVCHKGKERAQEPTTKPSRH
jgi:hypothetical protein